MNNLHLHKTPQRPKQQDGFSMLEVLISVFVLSVGLLSLLALQINSMQSNHSALYRTSATLLAYDMLERIRVNKTANYAFAEDDAVPAAPGNSMRERDLIAWNNNLTNALPNGSGTIVYNADIVTINVFWNDSRAGGNADQSFTVSSQP